jgi:hypothetical protein
LPSTIEKTAIAQAGVLIEPEALWPACGQDLRRPVSGAVVAVGAALGPVGGTDRDEAARPR